MSTVHDRKQSRRQSRIDKAKQRLDDARRVFAKAERKLNKAEDKYFLLAAKEEW